MELLVVTPSESLADIDPLAGEKVDWPMMPVAGPREAMALLTPPDARKDVGAKGARSREFAPPSKRLAKTRLSSGSIH